MSISGLGQINAQAANYLDWNDRPAAMQAIITNAFNHLAAKNAGVWGNNGAFEYRICGIDEHRLMKSIIQEAPRTQKEFNVIDIGAGDFDWGICLAEFIDEETDLPEGIQVNIYSVRGERNLKEKEIETKRCKLYHLGTFKIEEIYAECQKLKLDQVDLAVSHWCLRHLVDPTGTFAQIFNLLRPKTGYLLTDGFFFLGEQENFRDANYSGNRNLSRLLLAAKARFSMNYYHVNQSLNQFILQRPNETPCQLPMQYIGLEKGVQGAQISSGCITRFALDQQESVSLPHEPDCMYGDKQLYDALKAKQVFHSISMGWKPIQ